MNAADLCRRELITLPARATARDAARVMAHEHVGAVVVTDGDHGLTLGIVTDRDLALQVLAGEALPDAPLAGLCSPELVGVREEATLREAIEAMHTGGVRRVFVTRADGRVTGLLSLDDVIDALALEFEALAGALHSGIARERSRTGARGPAREAPQALYLTRHEP